jgi:hypothetical protein
MYLLELLVDILLLELLPSTGRHFVRQFIATGGCSLTCLAKALGINNRIR